MLYCRGRQLPDYRPTLADIGAVALRLFDDPPIVVRQIKL